MVTALGGAAIISLAAPRAAEAALTCEGPKTYVRCGRVFPDPEIGVDPWAEGLAPAGDFIAYGDPNTPGMSEIWDGLSFLEQRYGRFMELWRVDELLEDPDALSAGLWANGERQRHPLILVRVTDETVPAADKQRFAFGLSLHGIERAGVEGGTRAIEDMVTYAHCESLGSLHDARWDAVCAKQAHLRLGTFEEGEGGFPARLLPWDADSLTMGETLRRSELYFTYNNPDGWRRGDKVGGVGHYQRYNGNGVDPNRDWPTVGYTFRPYTPGSEPETKHFARALRSRGGNWGSGIDLHGMTTAPVLTYTMLPAGQHDYRKNARVRAIAERTQRDALERLSWSPLIVPFEQQRGAVNVPALGPVGQMWPQQWGTVWDSINYTVTGSFGDWINSPIGLDAIGMDNEMALSHITNCGVGSCFIPEVEQLHVGGNKGLIYADIDTTLRTTGTEYRFPFEARGAYVARDSVVEHEGAARALAAFRDLPAQQDIRDTIACPFICSYEFEITGPSDGTLNRGVTGNIGFIGPHTNNDPGALFILERWAEDPHGEGFDDWVPVSRNHGYNQGPYYNNGLTLSANEPEPGRWRFRFQPSTPGPYAFEILFHDEPAFEEPEQLAYRATQFDFFDELNRYLPPEHQFDALTTDELLDDPSVLASYDVIVLVDDPLDGWDEEKPKRSSLSKRQRARYYRDLRAFVQRGGTVVLLDGAVQGLAPLVGSADLETVRRSEYAGWIGFNNGRGPTYDDPLAAKINVAGAAEGSGNRHQTYEPVPLGYSIDQNSSPVWTVARAGFEAGGGRVVGMVGDGVVLGEVPLGKGRIRIAGALLPPPTEDFDHIFGLSSYALTYTGWQLFENLVQVEASGRGVLEPKVLAKRHLPATGFTTPLAWLAILALPAIVAARKLRDLPWV